MYVKTFQRARDGRGIFLALRDHYLGPNNVDNMDSQAEKKLTMMTYTGEHCCWTFEKYVTLHKDQPSILEGVKIFSSGLTTSPVHTGLKPRD